MTVDPQNPLKIMTEKSGRLENKIALVTGAASGIGRATVELFAREGAIVIASDIDQDGLARTVEPIAARPHQLDVTSEAQWESLIEEIRQRHGRLDVLVNSAGISFAAPVTEMTLEQWRRVMAVNLDSIFLGTRYALLIMRDEGSIINIASASGIKASPGASAYCTSKAAVEMFSRTAALEVAQRKIRVNTVSPGGVMTPMWENMDFWRELKTTTGSEEASWQAISADIPLKRFASADEVAQAILFLASDESRFVTAANLVIDGGYTA